MATGVLRDTPRQSLSAALADAGIAAGVAALLGLPLVGLHTVTVSGALALETRFGELAIAVALIFLGRLAMTAIRTGYAVVAIAGGAIVAVAGWLVSLPSEFLGAVSISGGGVSV